MPRQWPADSVERRPVPSLVPYARNARTHSPAVSRNANSKDIDHPAPFPVDLVSEMLTAFSDPDDIVYEPFCGSGTQLISAQKNGRTCLGMEIAPAYVDVAVLRWQAFTGQTATLEATGETFDQKAHGPPAPPADR